MVSEGARPLGASAPRVTVALVHRVFAPDAPLARAVPVALRRNVPPQLQPVRGASPTLHLGLQRYCLLITVTIVIIVVVTTPPLLANAPDHTSPQDRCRVEPRHDWLVSVQCLCENTRHCRYYQHHSSTVYVLD